MLKHKSRLNYLISVGGQDGLWRITVGRNVFLGIHRLNMYVGMEEHPSIDTLLCTV